MAASSGNRPRARTALSILALACLAALAFPGCSVEPPVFPLPPANPSLCEWDGVERVVAVGDLHGEYEGFVTILQAKGLIDEDERWIGGKAHLVQIGDVMDRGDEARRIFVMIARLEREAAEAGGMVHFLPGNHEELNIAGLSLGYEGYVSVQQFRDFLPTAVRDRNDRITAAMNQEDRAAYWKTLMRREARDGANSDYCRTFRRIVGRWIAGHNVIIKINGVLFVHGGINIGDSRRTLESINAAYQREFAEVMADDQKDWQFVFQPDSPLWYRGLEGGDGSSIIESDVKQILSNIKARAIVVGHTPTPTEGAKRFGGLVWMIDSNISSAYTENSQLSALEFFGTEDIQFKGVDRHAQKKRADGHGSFPGALGDVFLRARRASAAGHT